MLLDTEMFGDRNADIRGDATLTSFDPRQESSINPGQLGDLLNRQVLLLPEAAQYITEMEPTAVGRNPITCG
jgi:hypothetical protein